VKVSNVERMRQAVEADPDDAGARLAYADALEEAGELQEARAQRAAAGLPVYKTLKSARADGFRAPRPWEYGGERTVVKGREMVRNPREARTGWDWVSSGYRVREGESPIGGGLWRHDQVEPLALPPWEDVQAAFAILVGACRAVNDNPADARRGGVYRFLRHLGYTLIEPTGLGKVIDRTAAPVARLWEWTLRSYGDSDPVEEDENPAP
jgi:uncharacterized protein (TIGR02996 family)